jgi:AspBHI-like restriction endonuclease
VCDSKTSQCYRVARKSLNRGGISKGGDEFLAWVNIPGSGMPNSPGIRPLKYVHDLSPLPAYLVLVTHEKRRGTLNPWDDVVDHSTGQIIYWGDAKLDKTKQHTDFRGNKILQTIYNYLLDGYTEFAPPTLHFQNLIEARSDSTDSAFWIDSNCHGSKIAVNLFGISEPTF